MGGRPAEPGEWCTCGRQTRVVFLTEKWGPTGRCGLSDGGRRGVCWFCGAGDGHDGGRCPAYQLRPATTTGVDEVAASIEAPAL